MSYERERIRRAVVGLDTNYIGQEGRGAAADLKAKVLRVLEAEWAAQDSASARRTAVLAALMAELKGITQLNYPDYVADALAPFVLSLDDQTWKPPEAAA